MTILRFMLKGPSNICSRSQREQCIIEEDIEEDQEKVEFEEVVTFDKTSEEIEPETTSTFQALLRREDNRAYFSNTLQLKKHLSLKYSCGEEKSQSCTVGCKVRPVMCEAGPTELGRRGPSPDRGVQKRREEGSRMKDLIRWAAAAKTAKGGTKRWKVLYLRKKMGLKGKVEDEVSARSIPNHRISFRWDVASCSTPSSAFSPLSISSSASKISNKNWTNRKNNVSSNSATTTVQKSSYSDESIQNSLNTEEFNRVGQWITSDSEYVVLEL